MKRYQLEVENTEDSMWMNIQVHKNRDRIDMRIDSECLWQMEEIDDTITI